MLCTDQADTTTYRSHTHDKVHEKDRLEGGGAQRRAPKTVRSAATAKSTEGHARPRISSGESAAGGPPARKRGLLKTWNQVTVSTAVF